jgi:hypothetical protein
MALIMPTGPAGADCSFLSVVRNLADGGGGTPDSSQLPRTTQPLRDDVRRRERGNTK